MRVWRGRTGDPPHDPEDLCLRSGPTGYFSEFREECHQKLEYLHGTPVLAPEGRPSNRVEGVLRFLETCDSDHFLDFIDTESCLLVSEQVVGLPRNMPGSFTSTYRLGSTANRLPEEGLRRLPYQKRGSAFESVMKVICDKNKCRTRKQIQRRIYWTRLLRVRT